MDYGFTSRLRIFHLMEMTKTDVWAVLCNEDWKCRSFRKITVTYVQPSSSIRLCLCEFQFLRIVNVAVFLSLPRVEFWLSMIWGLISKPLLQAFFSFVLPRSLSLSLSLVFTCDCPISSTYWIATGNLLDDNSPIRDLLD
jgi:hypothetical protein